MHPGPRPGMHHPEKNVMQSKIKVAIMGATGAVGQQFIRLLSNHPMFEIAALTASDRSEGKRYADAAHWILDTDMPAGAREHKLLPTTAAAITACDPAIQIAFSALPNESAEAAEPACAAAGLLVFSNASKYRMAADVPLVITEVNWEHLNLLTHQRKARGYSTGGIVCNTNCTVSGPALSLKPLHAAFGVTRVFSTSMQAASGAGYPGVPSLDMIDNVIPFIKNEEEKMEWESNKLLGKLVDGRIDDAGIAYSAHCNRVAVMDGHMVTMSVELGREASPEDCVRVMRDWRSAAVAGLPMAPEAPIVVHDAPDRPQPRRDRHTGNGMSAVVGRVRAEPLFGKRGVKFITLAHNTIRGAAGGSVLNAEMCVRMGLI